MKNAIHILAAAACLVLPTQADDDLWESKGPHVRIKKNDQDGSYVVFQRSPDDRSLVKETKDQNGRITMTAKYTRDDKGFLRYGQIYDGQGGLMYRVQYGYDPQTGQLIAEQMFDARVKNYYPPEIRDEQGKRKEMPIRRVYYFYDADGNQSKAISLVPKAGKTAKEAFKKSKKPLDLYGTESGFDPDKQSTRPEDPFKKHAQ